MKQNPIYIKTVYLSIYKVLLIKKMYAHSDIPRSEPSIFVKDMHNSTDVAHVKKTFQSLGKIAKVEFNLCGNFKQAIIHFKYWYENADADSARVVLLADEDLHVMHELGKYWTTSPAVTRTETFKQESSINFNYELNTLELVEENPVFMEYEYMVRNSEPRPGLNYETAVSPPRRKQVIII